MSKDTGELANMRRGSDFPDFTFKVFPETVYQGDIVSIEFAFEKAKKDTPEQIGLRFDQKFSISPAREISHVTNERGGKSMKWKFDTRNCIPGACGITIGYTNADGSFCPLEEQNIQVMGRVVLAGTTDTINVSMKQTATNLTSDVPLWVVIQASTNALSFANYADFMDAVLCGKTMVDENGNEIIFLDGEEKLNELNQKRFLPFTDSEAYRLLKVATEAFVMVNCAVDFNDDFPFEQADVDELNKNLSLNNAINLNALDERWVDYLEAVNGSGNSTLPYLALIRRKLGDQRLVRGLHVHSRETETNRIEECLGIINSKLTRPCFLELIWSYWHEESMLVQTMAAITRRFQNVKGPGRRDPLAMMEIDPLRQINNLLWGFIQDEQHRLSIRRRAYEYEHHYGISLYGKAVRNLRPADRRSKFIEAFHHLLHLCAKFYKEDDDTTVIADGFPLLNSLKELHLILTEGHHNQYGDLPSTSRIEMMMQQWILARPEFREFLPTRNMVAYPEAWMDRVGAMNTLQGWTDTNVLHYSNLGIFGEKILLSIRFGAWSTLNDRFHAVNWARFWRTEIQGYIHAYRSVTGVDLTKDKVDTRQPAFHLKERLQIDVRSNGAGRVDSRPPSYHLRKKLRQQKQKSRS